MMANDRLVDWVLSSVLVVLCLLAWHQWQPLHVPDGGSGAASSSSASQQAIEVLSMVAATHAETARSLGAEVLMDVAIDEIDPATPLIPQEMAEPTPSNAILPVKAAPAGEAIDAITPTTNPELAHAPTANMVPKMRPADIAELAVQPKSMAVPKPVASLKEKSIANKDKAQNKLKKTKENSGQAGISKAVESKGGVDQVMSDAGQETFDRNQFSQEVKAQLARHKIYPKMAQRRRLEGRGVLELLLDGQGQLVGVRIVESTKHDILDSALLEMAQRAIPYPAHGQERVVPVRASVRFQR